MVKSPPANAGDAREEGLIPASGRCPGVGYGNPPPVSLPGNPHGQRSLAGCSPQGSWSQTRLSTHTFSGEFGVMVRTRPIFISPRVTKHLLETSTGEIDKEVNSMSLINR